MTSGPLWLMKTSNILEDSSAVLLMLQSRSKIIPVFYGVKPSDLRYIEKGVYAAAFAKHEQTGRYSQKLHEWKEALRSISLIAGYEINNFK